MLGTVDTLAAVKAPGGGTLLATIGAGAPQRPAFAGVLDEIAIVLHLYPASVELALVAKDIGLPDAVVWVARHLAVLVQAIDEKVAVPLEDTVSAMFAAGAGCPESMIATVEDEVAVALHRHPVLAVLGLEGAA